MNKMLAALLVGFFAVGAQAQGSPPGVNVPPNTPGVAGDKATAAGEARRDTRDARRGKGPAPTLQPGDQGLTEQGNAMAPNRAAAAGEARAQTRDARRGKKRTVGQGGTPK